MTYDDAPAPAVTNLHLQQLAYLRAVERAGTLTAAAAALHVSQPALSQSLSELERRLGVALFERRGRRRVLTEAGHEAVRYASEVLGRTAELRERLQSLQRGEAGTLRVGMIDAASLYLLPEAIRAFRQERPDVDLRLVVETSAELLKRLREFDLDLAFVIAPLEDDLETVELGREPLHIYSPAGSVESSGEADWALYPAGSRTRALIDEALAARGILPRVAMESSNPEILRQIVTLGLAWTVLPPGVAEASPTPLRRHDAEPLVQRSLVAATRRGTSTDPRAQTLLALAGGRVAVS
jgi:DNA-binding transcriptional LysR family regulator